MFHIEAIVLFAAVASACAAPPSNIQEPYGQCGGQNYYGPTGCTSCWTCVYSNPWYSQCLPVSPSAAPPSSSASATPVVTPPTVATAAASPTSYTASAAASSASSAPASSGVTHKASFTHYGAGDSFGSPNCQTNTAACGFFTSPGFAAAVSQNLYGAGPGAGAGPACGTCWKLVGETDSTGNALSNSGTSIVVMVNNLCPAQGNPLCSQNGLGGTNQYGANVNFDLCSDSGAAAAFFGNSGVGLAVGTATEVPCSEYVGTVVH